MAAEKTFQAWWARYSYRFEPGRILENSARTCWNDAAKLSEDSKTSTNKQVNRVVIFSYSFIVFYYMHHTELSNMLAQAKARGKLP